MARLHLETLNAFQFKTFIPNSLHHLHGTNCVLASDGDGKLSCLDVVSGDELCAKDLSCRGSGPVLTMVHPRSAKLVVARGGVMGARGMVEGAILLETILQPSARDSNSLITMEIPLVQVPKLMKELQTQSSSTDSELLSSILDQLEAKLANDGIMCSKSSPKWSTISFEGPVSKLYELFEDVFVKMKGSSTQGSAEASTEPQPSVSAGSAGLPIISAIRLRLLLLKPDDKLHRLELGGSSLEPDDVKLMYSEAMRRLSLQKWPHKDYVWAVPKTMAAAGFYQLSNWQSNVPHSQSQGDRTSCFLCHIYLYGWEKTDEPWSEHERHSPLCPFVHGECTENVPIAVTEGTHPAVMCVAQEEDCASIISTTCNSDLVAVGTKQGHITVWDISRALFIMECMSLDVSVQLLDECLSSCSFGSSSLDQRPDQGTDSSVASSDTSAHSPQPPFTPTQSIMVTSLCLLGSPSSALLQPQEATEGQDVLLVVGVTVQLEDRALPVLLLHNFKQRLGRANQNQAANSTQYGQQSYIPVLSSSTDHPAVETNLHALYSDSPTQSLLDLTSIYPLPTSLSGIENVLGDNEEETVPLGGGEATLPRCVEAQTLNVVPLTCFSSALVESPPDIRNIVPLSGGRLLAIHVRCSRSTGEYLHGGLYVYTVATSDSGQVVLGNTPTSTLKFTEEDEAVSVCAACRFDDQLQEPRDLIATVTKGGSVVVYGTDLVKVTERAPLSQDPYVCVCTQAEQLVVVRRSGEMEVLRMVPAVHEETTPEAPRDASAVIPTPKQLETFVQLTKCSSHSLPFYACTPVGWLEIPLLQYMRKSLAHVVYESDGSGQEELPHTKIWKYQQAASEKGFRSCHIFELTLNHHSSQIGCVNVQFNFADPHSISSNGKVTLLRPSHRHSHWSFTSPSGETLQDFPDSECLCGPVRVKQFLDITNHSVRINFCHPDLLQGHFTTLWLVVEDLFSEDCKNGSRASSSAATARSSSPSSSSRLASSLRHRLKATPAKASSSLEQGILLINLYPIAETSPKSVAQLGCFVHLLESPQFLTHLVLVACSYKVQRAEYENLPRPFQVRVENVEERDPLLLKENKLRALELLCWAGSQHSWRKGSCSVRYAVLPLSVSLLYSCYIEGGRELAHKCSRLIVALCRNAGCGDDGSLENPSRAVFLRSLCALLPFLLQCTSAACVHWLVRMLTFLSVGQQESDATMATCLRILVDMTRVLKEKSSLNTQILHTYFHQDGYVFEPELFDVYLSYSQKGSSKSAQKSTSAATATVTAPSPSSSEQPPSSSSQTTVPTSLPPPTVVDKRSHTIYDAELELLLEPLPPSGNQTGSRRFTSLKDPMGIFKHGSFLLYGQRGLLETHPLEYSCVSISGGAMVEEGHQHAFAAMTSASLPQQPLLPEPLKAVGYHFPTACIRKQERAVPAPAAVGGGIGSDTANTSKQVPSLLLTSLVLPKELVMTVESLKSGMSYSATLKFAQPVELTDFSIPSTEYMLSVTVDVWLGEDGEEGALRVAHSSEIMDKSLMAGNLMPPPLCQYVKVSFVGKPGASREKVQVFLGAFYGHPAVLGGEPLSPITLKTLENKILTEYYHAKEKLVSSLTQYMSVVNKLSDASLLKQQEDMVTTCSQVCFRLQVRLARLRNFVRQYQQSTGCGWLGGRQERVFELKDEVQRALLMDVSSSQLCKTIGCLVDALLVLSLNAASSVGAAANNGSGSSLSPTVSSPSSSYLSEENCSTLFMTLCVQGIPKLHARSCALLIALCGSQSWWGSFVAGAVTSLYSSSQTNIFHKERALLQLSALCQRTCASSNVMQCLLELLRSKLSCLLPDEGGTGGGGSWPLDQQLVQWLLLLLSHSFSSLSPSQRGNLFSPSLDLAPSHQPRQTSQVQQGAEEAKSTLTAGLSKGDWKNILRELSELKREMKGASVMPRMLDVILAEGAMEAKTPPQVLTAASSQVLPFSVTPGMCISMIKDLVEFVLLLIESSSCHFVPVACKALSHVLKLSGNMSALSALISQQQLDQLLFFLCQKSQLLTAGQDQGSLKWSLCSIEWLVVSLVCQSVGFVQPQQAQTLLSTIRRASGGAEGAPLHPRGSVELKSEAQVKNVASTEKGSVVNAVSASQVSSVKLLASLAKAMKKAGVHLHDPELLQAAESDAWGCEDLLSVVNSKDEGGAVSDGAPLQQQEQEASKDEGLTTTDTSDAGMKSDDTLSDQAQGLPDLKPKPKKKLSRQHSTSGMKYAPGDYTMVPSFATPPVNGMADFEQLPYASCIISGTVDSRLLANLELTAELELQCTARRVYEAVLWALALAKPLAPNPNAASSPSQCDLPAAAVSGCPDPTHGSEATAMLLKAIDCTLERARTSHCKLDIVPLLELWVWLNSLDWHVSVAPQKDGVSNSSSGTSQQANRKMILDVFSDHTLGLLMEVVLSAANLNQDARLCHLVIALFHSILRHLKAHAGGSPSFDFTIDVQKFSDMLIKLCSDWPECSTSEGEGPILVNFFTDLLCVRVVDCNGKKEPQMGILLLLDILSVIMEDWENMAIDSSALFRLVEVLGNQQNLKLLWNDTNQSCHYRTLSALRRLCTSVVDLLSSSVALTNPSNVALYVAELDEDRRKYRYLSVAHASQELRWIQVPLQTNTGSILISELLHLLRQALSSPVPAPVIECLGDFCHKEFPAENAVSDLDPLQVADAATPLLSIIYSNRAQLTSLLYLLNSMDSPLQVTRETSPVLVANGSIVQGLFLNFVHFLQAHCADPTCFFKPILNILSSLHSLHSDATISKLFVSFVGKLMAGTQKQGASQQLLGFIEQGGAKCVFDCFISSCQQSQLLPEWPLDHSISTLGSREIIRPFKEGSKLIDVLPLASVKLTPCRSNIRDLQNCAQSNYPSRSSAFHHVFNQNEEWLKMDICLHFPVLLHTVQLFQTLGSQFSSPSVIQISCASRPGSSPVLPVTPLVDTTRFPCIRLELLHPVVAQQVVVMMKKPMVSNSISLSHMHVLALEYGCSVDKGKKSTADAVEDSLHPCAGWLGIVDHWISQCAEVAERVLRVAEHHPELLSSCFALLQNANSLDSRTVSRLQQFVVAMVRWSPDLGIAAVHYLLGFPSLAYGGSKEILQAPATPSLVVNSVSTLLLNKLFQVHDQYRITRLHLSLKLLNSLLSPAHKELVNHLPPFIRVLAGAVWVSLDQSLPFDQELFCSFVNATLPLDLNSSLRSSMDSLLCAICRHSPDLFSLIIQRCQVAIKDDKRDMPNLLHMLAHVAKSDDRVRDLLSSELVRDLTSWLHTTFLTLRDKAHTNGTGIVEGEVQLLLSKASAYLAFLTDLSQDCYPVQMWLGTPENVKFWYPMIELLSLEPPFVSAFDISFCHDVTLDFFSACLCNQQNKVLFAKLLCNILKGAYSEKEAMNESEGPKTADHICAPVLTTFIYKLLVNLALKEESVTVLVQLLDRKPSDKQQPLPSLSLTRTTDAQEFHPSFPIGEHTYCVRLQSSCSMQQLEWLCTKSGNLAPPVVKKTPSEQPQQPFSEWDHNLRKFDLRHWINGLDNFMTTVETKDSSKSKSFSLVFTVPSTSEVILPWTLIGQLTRSRTMVMSGQLHLIAVIEEDHALGDVWCACDGDPEPNLLDLFIQYGGLEILAKCLPALYSHNWPEPISPEQEKEEDERAHSAVNRFRPHVLLHLMPHILFHSVLMFGLCMKIEHFCRALRENLPVASVLLKMVLGAELTGTLAKPMQQEFSFLPYLVFHKVLVTFPADTEIGRSLRRVAFASGVIHHTLFCLSVSGHHSPRVAEKDVTTRVFDVVSALETNCTTTKVTVSSDRHYWAKGTGFSTGSTASKWNMDAALARQRSGEKFMYICFAILAEYVGRGEGHTDHCTQELCDVFTTSCLLPATASYLLNDSVLDISKHIPLYNSVLELLFSIASNEPLRHLLTLSVYSDATTTSSDGNCLSSLLAKLGTLAKTYQRTAGMDITGEGSSPPAVAESELGVQVVPNRSSSKEQASNEESSLNELVSKIIVTDDKVANVVKAMQAEQTLPPKRPTDEQAMENSFSLYLKFIKPLQFRMYQMTEEDDNGRIKFKVPFFFDSRVQSSVSSSSSSSAAATRARRLAQEVATLSTSLPFSPSSSVFVCCDEERLDVMKVLITGPSETPYANGCFEFDVYFPPEYPRVPMVVNLMTTGQGRVRFNPNLYNDGKVCLSILNTWHGSPEEKWNAQTSSFLQVLVSIQSLILVPEPFFNEPGYEQYRGTGYGNLKSLAYNANICTATVQWAMINQLRNPSPCFKEVILQHFYLRQSEVLAQCEQWKNAIMKGIQMQTSGFELKEHLQNLTSSVDTLRTELSKLCPSDEET